MFFYNILYKYSYLLSTCHNCFRAWQWNRRKKVDWPLRWLHTIDNKKKMDIRIQITYTLSHGITINSLFSFRWGCVLTFWMYYISPPSNILPYNRIVAEWMGIQWSSCFMTKFGEWIDESLDIWAWIVSEFYLQFDWNSFIEKKKKNTSLRHYNK